MEFLANSLLELITQTSTNLPPDVRAAMSLAASQETPATQSSQALDIILSNVDMAMDDEGPICQDTGMPTFVVHTPVGVNQIAIKKRDPGGGGGGDPARQTASQFGRLAHRQEQRRQPGQRNAGDPLRAVGGGRNRGQADPQRRRLREQEHSVLGALQARSPGPRRPQSGRRPQVHSARGLAGAGAGLRAGRAGRLHRQRPRARLRPGEGATLPHAGRCQPDPGARQAGSRDHGGGQPPRRRRHGLRRQGQPDRL